MASAIRRLRPLFDRIVVSKTVPETKTAGGVILPSSAAQAENTGTVISVGDGQRKEDGSYIKVEINEGDKVLLPEFGGTKITMENEDFYIYRETEILGKLE
eukprot:m.11779 g.11779  ORF g.11779 m.11779 type:complete len:101 (+) comp4522_c0_seq1:330-632(+)